MAMGKRKARQESLFIAGDRLAAEVQPADAADLLPDYRRGGQFGRILRSLFAIGKPHGLYAEGGFDRTSKPSSPAGSES